MDSIEVTENEDGTFTLEWDPNDPKWSFLNDMPEEAVENFVNEALREFLKANGG